MSVLHQVALNGPVEREPLLDGTWPFRTGHGTRCDRDILLFPDGAGFDLLRYSGGMPGQFQLELLLTATVVRSHSLLGDRLRSRRQWN